MPQLVERKFWANEVLSPLVSEPNWYFSPCLAIWTQRAGPKKARTRNHSLGRTPTGIYASHPAEREAEQKQWEGVRSPPTRTNQPASSTSPFPIPSLGSNASSPGPPDPIPMPSDLSPKAWNHHHSPYDPIATPGSQSKYFLSPGNPAKKGGENPGIYLLVTQNESSCPQMLVSLLLPNERS